MATNTDCAALIVRLYRAKKANRAAIKARYKAEDKHGFCACKKDRADCWGRGGITCYEEAPNHKDDWCASCRALYPHIAACRATAKQQAAVASDVAKLGRKLAMQEDQANEQ